MLLFSSDHGFFDLFDRAADNMVRTAELFREMLTRFERREEIVGAIREAERLGDNITHDTISKLDQAFITPFDRDDIHRLSTQMDEVVDALEAAARRIILYKIEQPNEDILNYAEIALQTTRVLAQAIKRVRELKKQGELSRLLIEIHDWENKGDEQNHAALARLFETGDALRIVKWKELYELAEHAVDACETVANTLRSIMVKNA
jgi:hypothetical protein